MSFQFERDTFTFVNELVWQYRIDPASGATTVINSNPPPSYYHRCFVLVRSARQFYFHARFEPGQPAVDRETYRRLIRDVVSRSPRRESPPAERVTFPGYPSLRAFSQVNEPLLKAELGGPWQSYFLRSHWRMVFPIWSQHQQQMAQQLHKAVLAGSAPTIHLFRFPKITINHGLLLFGLTESEREIRFDAYDPNLAHHPVTLIYDRASRRFFFPPAIYWAGGPVSVVQIYRGGLY
jgi:hypothetical protein